MNHELHHACYVAGNKFPTWIQPANHAYRPRKTNDYSWVIVCVETGEIIEKWNKRNAK